MSPTTRKVDAKFLAFEKNKFANYPVLAFAAEHKKITICMVFTKSACGLPPPLHAALSSRGTRWNQPKSNAHISGPKLTSGYP